MTKKEIAMPRRFAAKWGIVASGCLACAVSVLSVAGGGAAAAGSSNVPIEPLVTLQDLMRHEVDANADPIWDSVGTIIGRGGAVERHPRTDADWIALRQHAVVLLEATNLLVIPGRKVSSTPFPSDGPGVLSSAEIQRQLDEHRDQFDAHALALRAVVAKELQAIDKHDVNALQALGGEMDAACESCHLENWYPHQVIPELPDTPKPPAPAARRPFRGDWDSNEPLLK